MSEDPCDDLSSINDEMARRLLTSLLTTHLLGHGRPIPNDSSFETSAPRLTACRHQARQVVRPDGP